MSRKALIFVAMLALAGVLSACAGQDTPTDSTGMDVAGLTLEETEAGHIGSYVNDWMNVEFSTEMVATEVYDIVVQANGLTLTWTIDREAGVIEYDGFATESGEPTMMGDEDREVLVAFTAALDALGPEVPETLRLLRAYVGTWKDWSEGADLNGQTIADPERGWYSICHLLASYQAATHDCVYTRWEDTTTTDYAYVSTHAACVGGEGTYHWNGSWQCYDPGHTTNIEYAYGNCYGRCGGGCGSSTQFTWDCLDQDQCGRAGHTVTSFWCSDELAAVSDDLIYAPDCL